MLLAGCGTDGAAVAPLPAAFSVETERTPSPPPEPEEPIEAPAWVARAPAGGTARRMSVCSGAELASSDALVSRTAAGEQLVWVSGELLARAEMIWISETSEAGTLETAAYEVPITGADAVPATSVDSVFVLDAARRRFTDTRGASYASAGETVDIVDPLRARGGWLVATSLPDGRLVGSTRVEGDGRAVIVGGVSVSMEALRSAVREGGAT